MNPHQTTGETPGKQEPASTARHRGATGRTGARPAYRGLFSDAASATTAPQPAPRPGALRPPLDTLTWQAPPAGLPDAGDTDSGRAGQPTGPDPRDPGMRTRQATSLNATEEDAAA